jgi:hypothetical protein
MDRTPFSTHPDPKPERVTYRGFTVDVYHDGYVAASPDGTLFRWFGSMSRARRWILLTKAAA